VEILVIHPGALGDVILSLPALALLRKDFAGARITMAGNLDYLRPVTAGYVESIVSLSTLPLHRLYGSDPLPGSDIQFWCSFDKIISWTGFGDKAFVRNLTAIHADARIASWKPGTGEQRHVSQLFVDSLGLGGIATPARIHVSPVMRSNAGKWLVSRGWEEGKSLVALHPGAGSRLKRVPVECFAELGQKLVEGNRRLLLIIEGPAEVGLAGPVAGSIPGAIVAESISLDLLAAVLELCELFVGNDSGIAHLAAGLGVRSFMFFGPTLPQHWAPLSENAIILALASLEKITVQDLFAADVHRLR
jgi:heptosyltransferase III